MKEKESQTLLDRMKEKFRNIDAKKRKIILLGSAAGVVAAAGIAVVVYLGLNKKDAAMQAGQRLGNGERFNMQEMMTASGTTTLGYTMDEFEPDYIETEIYIEEVYLSSGDEVEAGTPVFKVSAEDVQEAREELEEKKTETSLAHRAGLITYEQSKINAKYTLDAANLEGKQAEAVYKSSLKEAEEKLQQAKDAVTEAEENIKEYSSAYANYYYDYNIDDYKERAEKNYLYYYTFLEEYGLTTSEAGGVGQQPSAPSDLQNKNNTRSKSVSSNQIKDVLEEKVPSSNQDSETYTRRLSTIQQMKKNMEESQSYLDKAWEEYKTAAEKADTELKKLKVQVESLRADLTEAQTTYELEVLEAETAYQKSLAQSKLAQSDYDAAMQKAEDELAALEDDKTEAEENLTEFEELLGDGIFYTQNAGTVMMLGVREESNLQGGNMVVAYRNPEDISVTVSVSQEDIHKLAVGDTAQVMVENYGTFEGKITYLNPISNSESRTNITYEVIVDVNGENKGGLTENLTASVIFNIDSAESK